jgi:hypothetical protein
VAGIHHPSCIQFTLGTMLTLRVGTIHASALEIGQAAENGVAALRPAYCETSVTSNA